MSVRFTVTLFTCTATIFGVLFITQASPSTFGLGHVRVEDPVDALQVTHSRAQAHRSAHFYALIPRASARSSKGQQGLTYEQCSDDGDCADGRTCRYFAGPTPRCAGRKPCRCLYDPPQLLRPCFLDRDCPSGETCANTFVSGGPVCASQKEARRSQIVQPANAKPTGLSFDGCQKDTDCVGDRSCVQLSLGSESPFPACELAVATSACACLPKNVDSAGFKCFTSADCGNGEVCARTPFVNVTTCTSKNAEESYDSFSDVPKPGLCPVRISQDPPQNADTERYLSQHSSFDLQASSRIVGGGLASANLQKYMVAVIDLEQGGLCSGVLVSSRWIMSAGTCNVTTGSSVLIGESEVTIEAEVFNVKRVFTQPGYFADDGIQQLRYAISVAELDKPAPPGSKFMELNSDPEEPTKGKDVRSIGYGSTYYVNAKTKTFALRQVDVQVADFKACRNNWKDIISISPKKNMCIEANENCSPW